MRKAQPTDKSRKNEEQDASLAEPQSIDDTGAEDVSEDAASEETVVSSAEEIAGEEISAEEIRGAEIRAEEVLSVEVVEETDETAEESEDAEIAGGETVASDDSPDDDDALSEEAGAPAVDVAALGDAVRAAGELGDGGQPLLPQLLPNPTERRALLEAIVYVAEDPLTAEQIAAGLQMPLGVIQADLDKLAEESQQAERGLEIRKVAGGYKMFTKAEHHDAIRNFVRSLRPKLKLSLPALETLAVIAYKQPVTVPEIQAIRGVNAGGVIHTLLSHKLITTAGRKKVIGRPMQYKTTKEFLVQFGLNDLSELPNLKELEELSRQALGEGEEVIQAGATGAGVIEPHNGSAPNVDAESSVELEGDTGEDPEDSAEAVEESAEFVADEQNPHTEPREEASNEKEPPGAASAAVAGVGHSAASTLDDETESGEDSEERN